MAFIASAPQIVEQYIELVEKLKFIAHDIYEVQAILDELGIETEDGWDTIYNSLKK